METGHRAAAAWPTALDRWAGRVRGGGHRSTPQPLGACGTFAVSAGRPWRHRPVRAAQELARLAEIRKMAKMVAEEGTASCANERDPDGVLGPGWLEPSP